jgi:hypothetical protein
VADEYVFIDEWEVEAPHEAVFEALADARTYPEWWRPVYLKVDADCPPQVGCVSHQEFKGRLPYHLKTRSEICARCFAGTTNWSIKRAIEGLEPYARSPGEGA